MICEYHNTMLMFAADISHVEALYLKMATRISTGNTVYWETEKLDELMNYNEEFHNLALTLDICWLHAVCYWYRLHVFAEEWMVHSVERDFRILFLWKGLNDCHFIFLVRKPDRFHTSRLVVVEWFPVLYIRSNRPIYVKSLTRWMGRRSTSIWTDSIGSEIP